MNGEQVEFPDFWLNFGNPWEIQRYDVIYDVGFGGSITSMPGGQGEIRAIWEPKELVQALAYDVPIPGYKTDNTLGIRLWSAKPKKQFDLYDFNAGRYQQSVSEKQNAENITQVLYPNDNTPEGKELRLRQQYFFVCATLQDIVRRFKKTSRPWSEFSSQVAIQLNDTHPTLGVVELQRILIDYEVGLAGLRARKARGRAGEGRAVGARGRAGGGAGAGAGAGQGGRQGRKNGRLEGFAESSPFTPVPSNVRPPPRSHHRASSGTRAGRL